MTDYFIQLLPIVNTRFYFFFSCSGPMEWSEQHDIALMKEVRVQNPFKAKKKTSNRAQIWLSIAEALSGLKDPLFKDSMTKRSVQDRYVLLAEKYSIRMKREAKASGTSPSFSELDQLIEEYLEVEKLEEDLRQKAVTFGVTRVSSLSQKFRAENAFVDPVFPGILMSVTSKTSNA